MFKKAIELDSRYASAYVGLGWAYFLEAMAGWTESPIQAMEKALASGQKALSIGEPDALTYALLGSVYLRLEKYDLAISELQRAIDLNPNHALSHLRRGTSFIERRDIHAIYVWTKKGLFGTRRQDKWFKGSLK